MKSALLALVIGCGTAKPAPAPVAAPLASNVPPADPDDVVKITAIVPANGDPAGGTQAKITGTRLLPAAQKDLKVFFGAQAGEVVRVQSDTELFVIAPAGTAGTVVDVRVTYEGGELKLPHAFTYAAKS